MPQPGPPAAPPPPPPSGWGQQPPGGYGSWGPAAPPPPGLSWRPQALQPGIIPLRPLGMGEIYDGAFRAVRANPRVMFGLAALVVTLAVILQSVIQWYVKGILAPQLTDLSVDLDPSGQMGFAEQVGSSIGLLIAAPVTSIATTILTGLLIVSVSRSVLGQVATVGEVLRSWRVWLVVGFTFLSGIAILAVLAVLVTGVTLLAVNDQVALAVLVGLGGSLAFVVAAVWFATRTLLVPPALMLEGKKFWPTIARAWRLTRRTLLAPVRDLPAHHDPGRDHRADHRVPRDPHRRSSSCATPPRRRSARSSSSASPPSSRPPCPPPSCPSVVALLYIDVRMRREGLDVELARAAESDRVNLLARVVGGVPVDPDAATARRWAAEELLDPVYHEQRSLLSRLVDWLAELLAGLRTPGGVRPVAVLAVVGVLVAVVVVAFLVAGPVRRLPPWRRGPQRPGGRRRADLRARSGPPPTPLPPRATGPWPCSSGSARSSAGSRSGRCSTSARPGPRTRPRWPPRPGCRRSPPSWSRPAGPSTTSRTATCRRPRRTRSACAGSTPGCRTRARAPAPRSPT